jgi:hypothetical protein
MLPPLPWLPPTLAVPRSFLARQEQASTNRLVVVSIVSHLSIDIYSYLLVSIVSYLSQKVMYSVI